MHKYWSFRLKNSNSYFLQSEKFELRWRLYRQPVYDPDMCISNITNIWYINTCHVWVWSWLSQAWSGGFINHYHQKKKKVGENSSRINRTKTIRAPLLLHDVNRKKVNRAYSSGLKGNQTHRLNRKKGVCRHKRNPTKAKRKQTMKITWKQRQW